jgi:precorrin-6Y C5,15-methyltransferase (decarboxylating)
MRTHVSCRAVAVELRADRRKRIEENAAKLGVPGLVVVEGHAPEALEGLDTPDAVFVGGGATEPGLLDACWRALGSGGRLVVHGVTLETERVLAERHAAHGGELTRLHVEHAEPIGSFTGWTPSRAITQWSVTKP